MKSGNLMISNWKSSPITSILAFCYRLGIHGICVKNISQSGVKSAFAVKKNLIRFGEVKVNILLKMF